ncbi:hypothetical protein OKW45_004172 [Paraburkholderia sp. WSM4175]
MSIVTIRIDLAKNVFAVHGVDEAGKAVLIRPRVSRDQLVTLIAQLPACLIGMEACSGAHHWAQMFQQYGHTVKLMAPETCRQVIGGIFQSFSMLRKARYSSLRATSWLGAPGGCYLNQDYYYYHCTSLNRYCRALQKELNHGSK